MSEQTIDQPDGSSDGAGLSERVHGKLSALRRGLRVRVLAEGVCWLLVTLVTVVLATLAMDYLLRLERPQRMLVMGLTLAAVLWVIWSQLIRPASARMSLVDLSLLVERRFPQLEARLVSAVQFEAFGAPAAVSQAMVDRVVGQANYVAGPLAFGDVIERRQLSRNIRLALSAVGLLIGLTVWQTDLVRLWAARNVLFADVAWPQQTYLTVLGEDPFTVLRGDDLTVDVLVESKSPPPSITVHARYPSVGWTEETVDLIGNGVNRYQIVFHQVAEPFEFYVVGGDDRLDKKAPHSVRLVDPPGLRDVQFLVEFPDYMDRPGQVIDGSSGVLVAPVGSRLHIQGVATKDLKAAEVVIVGDRMEIAEPLQVDSMERRDGSEASRYVTGRVELTAPNQPAALTLQIRLTDTEGYMNRRGGKYVLRLQPDMQPAADCRKMRIGTAVTPHALIPLAIQAKDDAGVAAVTVTLRRTTGETESEMAVEPVVLTGAAPGRTELVVLHEFDLIGRGLSAGETISLSAEAVDILPGAMGGPNRHRSNAVNLRVIRPEELMSELLERRRAIRVEFMQAQAQQQTAIARTASAGNVLARADGGVDISHNRLTTSAGVQRSVHAEIAKTHEKLLLIADEMSYNRLGEPGDVQELHARVINPLAELAGVIETTLAELQQASQTPAPTALATHIERIATAQQDIARRMERILDAMIKIESRQELANQLRVIVKWEEEILEAIRKRQEEEIGTVFNPDDR